MPLPLLLLLIVATTIGAQSECPGPIGDLRWFQNNAQTLLFMQHLQEKAIVEDLHDWPAQIATDTFQERLQQLKVFVTLFSLSHQLMPHGSNRYCAHETIP